MKDKLYFLSLSFCLLCFSCSAGTVETEKRISCIVERDTIDTRHYFYVNGFFENNSGIYFYGLKVDTIFLYKENAGGHFELNSYILLPKQYAQQYSDTDNIAYIEQLIFINMDSIIIFHQNHLALFSVKQDSVFKKFYHSRDNDWFNFVARGETFLRWNKKRKTLPLVIYRWDNHDIRKWRGDTEIVGEYSFEKDTFFYFPVKLPYDPYNNPLKTDYCGNADELFAFNGDTFVISFQITPATYLYNAASNRIDSLFLQNSTYITLQEADTARARDISRENYMDELQLENNYYSAIVYDEYKQVYYRFFSKAMPRKNAEGLLNTWEDKESGLTVLDNNLQIIGDVLWSNADNLLTPHYPTSKGVYEYHDEKGIIYKRKLSYEK